MGRGGPSGYRLLAWRGGARFHVPAGLVGGFCLTTTRVPDRTRATATAPIRDIVGHVTGSITGFITGCLTETIATPAAPPRTRSRVPHDVVGTLSGIRRGHQR